MEPQFRIFLSYSRAQLASAEKIEAALSARDFGVFFDRTDLPSGQEFTSRIAEAIKGSQLFIFLISPDSVCPGSYTLSELDIRRHSHPNPSGTLLPVMLKETLPDAIPAYLQAVNILYPPGNVPADISAAVDRLRTSPPERAAATAALGVSASAATLVQERIGAYRPLWQLTGILPKWPKAAAVTYEDLRNFSEALREWYFVGAGGMFLSRTAHTGYAAVQNALTAISDVSPSGVISEQHYSTVRELCSALRTCLADDIKARD